MNALAQMTSLESGSNENKYCAMRQEAVNHIRKAEHILRNISKFSTEEDAVTIEILTLLAGEIAREGRVVTS